MFPSVAAPTAPRRSFRAAVANAADLMIAFFTLEGYGLNDLRRAPAQGPAIQPGARSGERRRSAGRDPAGDLGFAHAARSRSLGPGRRSRRPGATASREHFCSAPLLSNPGSGTTRPRYRSPHQDASH